MTENQERAVEALKALIKQVESLDDNHVVETKTDQRIEAIGTDGKGNVLNGYVGARKYILIITPIDQDKEIDRQLAQHKEYRKLYFPSVDSEMRKLK